jgi:hypothetical protein
MNRTAWLQDRRMQKFRDVRSRWERKELSVLEAVEMLGVSERQFRRCRRRYEEEDLGGLIDRRLGKASVHIAAYSPEARGRSERMFGTLQDRLAKELRLAGITDIEAANRFIRDVYLPAHNARFARPPQISESAQREHDLSYPSQGQPRYRHTGGSSPLGLFDSHWRAA